MKVHREDAYKAEKELSSCVRNHEIQLKQLNDSHREAIDVLTVKVKEIEESKMKELDRLQSKLEVHLQTV